MSRVIRRETKGKAKRVHTTVTSRLSTTSRDSRPDKAAVSENPITKFHLAWNGPRKKC
jgi:hypothetical protein